MNFQSSGVELFVRSSLHSAVFSFAQASPISLEISHSTLVLTPISLSLTLTVFLGVEMSSGRGSSNEPSLYPPAQAVCEAIAAGEEKLEALLSSMSHDERIDALNRPGHRKFGTPICVAVEARRVECLRKPLAAGADPAKSSQCPGFPVSSIV